MIIPKTPEQIEGIRASCKLAKKVLNYAGSLVKPGVTTKYLNDAANELINDSGGKSACLNYKGFPAESCISVNNIVAHGIPSDKVILKEGDIVKIDICTVLDKFFGDTCGTFSIGEISPMATELIRATKRCLALGIKECRPGKHFGDIGYVIQKYANQCNFKICNLFCGHGISDTNDPNGDGLHTEPQVFHTGHKNTGPLMKPNFIFTIEPILNIGTSNVLINESDHWTARTADGSLSAQFEDSILITETGCEILTI